MIKPFTAICMILAAGSGLYLYQTKHRSQMLDREIGRTLKQIDVVKARIAHLSGEWANLNEPDRLAQLNTQHLGLRTLAPTQFARLEDLPARLPAPLPPGRSALPLDDGGAPTTPDAIPITATVPLAARPGPRPALLAAPLPQSPARTPVAAVIVPAPAPPLQVGPQQLAAMPAVAAIPVPPAAAPRPRSLERPVDRAADRFPVVPGLPVAPALPVAPPPAPPAPRFAAPVMSLAAAPMVVPPPAARAPALPARPVAERTSAVVTTLTATAGPIASVSASALGGPRTVLPPPVPFAAAR